MKLEDILHNEINRRDFLIRLAAASALGCSSDSDNGFGYYKNEPKERSPTPGGGGSSGNKDPAGDYTRIKDSGYVAQSSVVERGYNGIEFSNNYGTEAIYPVEEDSDGNRTFIGENIILGLYENSTDMIVSAYDMENRYLPNVEFISKNASGKILGRREIELYLKDKLNKAIEFGRNAFMKNIESALPNYDPEHIISLPGVVYQGDWSFNQVKNLNTLINESSTVLTFIPGPHVPITTKISIATEISGGWLDSIDEIIDMVNESTSLNIDKDYKFSWYIVGGIHLIVPSELIDSIKRRNPRFGVLDFVPLESGNQWSYNSSEFGIARSTIETKTINDKKIISVRSSTGTASYYGYRNGELKLMGADHPNSGEFYFEPGVVIGDDSMRLGDVFETNSKVIYRNYPGVDVNIVGTNQLEKFEHVSVPAGEFGDCLKVREILNFNGRNRETGEDISFMDTAYSWSAKNVGTVKSRIEGTGILSRQTSELQSAEINGTRLPKIIGGEIVPILIEASSELCRRLR